jgi:hypothetical protein
MYLKRNNSTIVGNDFELSILRFCQFDTYDGLLIGIPHETINKNIINWTIENAKKISELKEVYLIEPIQISIQNKGNLGLQNKIEYKELPYVTCIMKVTSTNIRNCDGDSAFMCIVWFQNDFAFPIDSEIQKQIEAIPFKEHCIYQCDY